MPPFQHIWQEGSIAGKVVEPVRGEVFPVVVVALENVLSQYTPVVLKNKIMNNINFKIDILIIMGIVKNWSQKLNDA